MTKLLALLAADGSSAAPSPDYGSVPPGTTSPSRTLSLKNTGDEAVTSIRGHIEQTSVADGEYHVTVNSVALTGTAQELLSSPLAVGATLNINEYWTVPAGLTTTGPDSGTLVIEYDQ